MNVLGVGASAFISAGQAVQARAVSLVNAAATPYGAQQQPPTFSPLVSGGSAAIFTQDVSQTNLITNAIGLMQASTQYQIAASALHSQHQNEQTLLRIFA
jgi:hypothetical protein